MSENGKTTNSKKKLNLSPIAVIDNMVFSKTDGWAYYRLTNNVFDFLSTDQKVSLALRISNALNNLMTDKQESLDCHLIVTTVPVDVDAWEGQIRGTAEGWDQSPGFERFLQEQILYLKEQEYKRRVCFLGINLGKRGALDMSGLNVLEAGFKGAADTFKLWLDSILRTPGNIIEEKEEDQFRKKEADFFRTLSLGHLQATRCTSEDILLLIKRQFYPAMPAPYLDVDVSSRLGPGDLELELGSAIENKYRWLKINQMFQDIEVAGYRAALSFAKFPKHTMYPNNSFPFLYFPAKLNGPFTIFSRFTLHPSSKMKADVEKKKKEQKDELENLSGAQDQYDSVIGSLPSDVVQSLDDINLISDMISSEKTPWVEGSYHIVVEATSEERLREYCARLKQRYDDLGILLQWTAGDQTKLFLEQMPGDRMRVGSFKQITNLNMLSTSGMNFSSDVGDPIYGTD